MSGKIFILFLGVVAAIEGCRTKKDKGRACGKPQSIRWYYNEKKFQCMVFTYLGCGGNENNFATFDDCQERCSPSDGPTCFSAEFAKPADKPKNVDSSDIWWCQHIQCPAGFECQNGAFFSQCCNKTAEGWFEEANNPKCRNGRTALQINGHIAIADSCNDVTCPKGNTCETSNHLFAKCCS